MTPRPPSTLSVAVPGWDRPLEFTSDDSHIIRHLETTCPWGAGHPRGALTHYASRGDLWSIEPVRLALDGRWAALEDVDAPYKRSVKAFGRRLSEGSEPPAVLVQALPAGGNPVADGQHRVAAALEAGISSIRAYICLPAPGVGVMGNEDGERQREYRDVLRESLGLAPQEGRPLTYEEILSALPITPYEV